MAFHSNHLRLLFPLTTFLASLAAPISAVPLERFDRVTEPLVEHDFRNPAYAAQQADKANTLKERHNTWYATSNRPMGLEPYSFGGHYYYRAGQSIYAPYFYQGRTIYVYIPQKDGRPFPPPLTPNLEFIFIQ